MSAETAFAMRRLVDAKTALICAVCCCRAWTSAVVSTICAKVCPTASIPSEALRPVAEYGVAALGPIRPPPAPPSTPPIRPARIAEIPNVAGANAAPATPIPAPIPAPICGPGPTLPREDWTNPPAREPAPYPNPIPDSAPPIDTGPDPAAPAEMPMLSNRAVPAWVEPKTGVLRTPVMLLPMPPRNPLDPVRPRYSPIPDSLPAKSVSPSASVIPPNVEAFDAAFMMFKPPVAEAETPALPPVKTPKPAERVGAPPPNNAFRSGLIAASFTKSVTTDATTPRTTLPKFTARPLPEMNASTSACPTRSAALDSVSMIAETERCA